MIFKILIFLLLINCHYSIGEEIISYYWDLEIVAGKNVSEIKIEIPGTPSKKDIMPYIHSINKPLDLTVLNNSIKNLFLTGIFSDVLVKAKKNKDDSITLIYHLTPVSRIHNIIFKGNKKISKWLLLSLVNINSGDVYSGTSVLRAIEKMQNFYRLKGYNQISIKSDLVRLETGRLIVIFLIAEGSPETIKTVEFVGANGIEKKLLRVISLKEGKILDSEQLEKDKEKIITFLKNNFYHFAKINDPVIQNSTGKNTDNIIVWKINLNERANFKFRSSDPFQIDLFKKTSYDMDFFYNYINLKRFINFNPTVEREISDSIKSFFNNNGFPDIKVIYKAVPDNLNNIIQHTFFIDIGNQYTFDIFFVGVEKMSHRSLKNVIINHSTLLQNGIYNKTDIESAIDNLISYYRSNGYIEARLLKSPNYTFDREKSRVFITIDLLEGPKTTVRSINISGITDNNKNALIKKTDLYLNRGFNPLDIDTLTNIIEDDLKNNGFYFATTETQNIVVYSDDKLFVDLYFEVQKGYQIRIGEIIFQGNYISNNSIIMREIINKEVKLITGEILTPQKLRMAQEKISSTKAFQSVTLVPKINIYEPTKMDIIIKTIEKAPGLLKFGVGYKNEVGLRLSGSIINDNLMGMNRTLFLHGELNQRLNEHYFKNLPNITNEYLIQLGFIEPWLFNSGSFLLEALRFSSNFTWERLDNDTIRIDNRQNITTSLEKQLSRYGNIKLNYHFEKYNAYHKGEQKDLSGYTSKISPVLELDHRNNLFNPTSGSYNTITIEWSSPILYSKSHFLKLKTNSNFYLRLPGSIVFATSLRTGTSYCFSPDESGNYNLPIMERYYLGGRSTVRGFKQDLLGPKENNIPIGGNHFINYKNEIRKNFTKLFGAVLFLDGGNVFLKKHPYKMRHSWGLGLRYLTPIGPISFEYGMKIYPEFDESKSALHISIGTF